jgi:cyclopropane-fatty-acyl-phospholipid synthase
MLREALLGQLRNKLWQAHLPLAVRLWNGELIEPTSPHTAVRITVHRAKAVQALARPTLGKIARAYVEGDIDIDGDIRDIIQIGQVLCNADACRDAPRGAARQWWRHTRSKDRRNIAYHYDVSNDFYSLWLDRRRVYSCAFFESPDDDLDTAQEKKLDLICRKLMLKPGERLLDIGCGWGGLIFYAAEKYGVIASGITLSDNQRNHVENQIKARGLQGQVDVRMMDYRDVPNEKPFDKIASVGMFEHVGRANLHRYFKKIYSLLRPGGLVINHGITSVGLDTKGLGSGISDFIHDYVFPGGELVHISTVARDMSLANLECLDIENLRPHYAKTLWSWVERMQRHKDEAIHMIGEKKYRIWRIYMAGSAYAFERNWMALYQLLGGRPLADGRQEYPFSRRHVYQ